MLLFFIGFLVGILVGGVFVGFRFYRYYMEVFCKKI